ncbi:MAG: VOC family protein [Acidimicrobiia bacterium]|nr:VOC family protein [Acidimicrobiia bacterium]
MTPRLDLVGLIVKDMAASLAFYRRLGFDLAPELDGESHVESRAGGLRIAWDTVEVIQSFSSYEKPAAGHRISLAFLCESPHEVDQLFNELTASGYPSHVEPFDAFWGQRYATVLDPDENPVDLFAPLPSSG